ncbi:hypothetical protein EJB05_18457 [Eragrostis curvula]|uniref:Uncharacterized protein n=1 Tax=Eragrostis curvula TaxID=38414 RepID=A0A5J9VN93_9POAL|nr:hypothetical protein EJB05_18457 [Eragrostis curvula]
MARTVVDCDWFHEIGGPRLAGGAGYLAPRIGLFTDYLVLQHIRTDKAFRDYLELREEASKKAVKELVSTFTSPADLFFLTDLDNDLFERHLLNRRALIEQYCMIDDGGNNGSGIHNISKNLLWSDDLICHKHNKAELLHKLYGVRRYFAYRKSLLKLDFVQWNSDPEEVLKRIKSSNRWSALSDPELKLGLKSHMDLLKEHRKKLGSSLGSGSISEFENVALERINSEMGSEIEELLYEPEKLLMHEYFHGVMLRNLAKECSTQAENTGVILLQQFLPLRTPVKEHVVQPMLPYMKQAVKQSVDGWMGYLRGHVPRVKPSWRTLVYGIIGVATIGTAGKPDLRPI